MTKQLYQLNSWAKSELDKLGSVYYTVAYISKSDGLAVYISVVDEEPKRSVFSEFKKASVGAFYDDGCIMVCIGKADNGKYAVIDQPTLARELGYIEANRDAVAYTKSHNFVLDLVSDGALQQLI